ncbi:hypothetical protein EVAR_22183_1 [Eumeta japonica]|uniref:Uncharacterized protein n=1 Tax=Eumeta variegata TaxID=151549 RepID=A0A4C1XV57_EUMVA|nr:hypothetical protein EVAR_22183_1 [Eumeta japonica]
MFTLRVSVGGLKSNTTQSGTIRFWPCILKAVVKGDIKPRLVAIHHSNPVRRKVTLQRREANEHESHQKVGGHCRPWIFAIPEKFDDYQSVACLLDKNRKFGERGAG